MRYILILLSILFLLSGCVSREPEMKKFKQREVKALELAKKINNKSLDEYIKISKDNLETISKWFDRTNAIDLTIYVAYNGDESSTKLYKILQKISQDKRMLDNMGYGDISTKYKSIKVLKYSYGSEQSQKVDAAYSNRLFDKEVLNDVLRDNTKTDYQELSISINTDALDDNKFMLEGYKTIKYADKRLNSYYYQLTKKNVESIDDKVIENALISILKLSIPEYVSIDRNDIKTNKALKLVYQQEDGSFLGTVYKMKIDNAIAEISKKREKELKNNPKSAKYINEKYDKILKTIKASSKWVKYRSKQLLYTTPISQDTLDVLKEQNYLENSYDAEHISIEQAKKISKILNIQMPDYYLVLSYPMYQHVLNKFEINIGEVNKMDDTYFIKSENQVKADSSADLTASSKNTGTAIVNGLITTLAIMAKSSFNTLGYEDAKYTYVKPKKQEGKFYPTSKFIYDNIGIKAVYTENFSHFEHALYTIPAGVLFYIDTKKNELGLLDKDKNEIIVIDIKTSKKLRVMKDKEVTEFIKKFKHTSEYYSIEYFRSKYYRLMRIYNRSDNVDVKRKFKKRADEQLDLIKKIKHDAKVAEIKVFPNIGAQSDSHGGRCEDWVKREINTILTPLTGGSYLQTYECSPFIDIFDKDKNFIKRNSAHGGYILQILSLANDKYIVTEGKYSSKIWTTKVFDFISKKY